MSSSRAWVCRCNSYGVVVSTEDFKSFSLSSNLSMSISIFIFSINLIKCFYTLFIWPQEHKFVYSPYFWFIPPEFLLDKTLNVAGCLFKVLNDTRCSQIVLEDFLMPLIINKDSFKLFLCLIGLVNCLKYRLTVPINRIDLCMGCLI